MTIWHHKRTLRPGGQSCHNEGLQDVESWRFALPHEAQPSQGLAKLEYSGGEILTRWFLICCRCKGWWSTWLPMKFPPCQGFAIFLESWSFIQLNEIWWQVSQFLTWRWPGKRRTATQLIQPLDDTPSGAKTSSRLSKILFWEPPFYLCSFLTPAHIDDASEHSPLLKAVNLQQHKTTNYSVIGGEK